MIRRNSNRLGIALLAIALCFGAARARADEAGSGYKGGLKLIWGSVPSPDFAARTGIANSAAPVTLGMAPDLGMTFTLPGDPGERFLFSPRMPQLAPALGTPAPNRAYLGLRLGLGNSNGLYGSLGIGGSVPTKSNSSFEEPTHGIGAAPLLLHGGFELGYHLTDRQSLSVNVDRVTPTDAPEHTDSVGTLRLRYGLKF